MPVPLQQTPFRIALVGDFTGRASRNDHEVGSALAARAVRRVDRDDLGEVMRQMAPTLKVRLSSEEAPILLRFTSLDEFHPDHLFQELPIFRALRDVRRELSDPATYAAAARALTGEAPSPTRAPSGGGLLNEILDDASPLDADAALRESGGDLHAFLERMVRPHLVPRADPQQAELVALVDAAISTTMRAILHAPAFQALEAVWRGVDLLVRRLETSGELQIHLIDLSDAELAAALPPDGDPMVSPLRRLLSRAADDTPWAIVAGAFRFGSGEADAERLAQLGAIGHSLGAAFVSEARPELVGALDVLSLGDHAIWKPSPDPSWEAFRTLPLARWVGLVAPGFLLRAPYGRDFEACELFVFEEHEGAVPSGECLWGPPAFVVALLLGRAFAEVGWRFAERLHPVVGGLPWVMAGAPPDDGLLPVGQVLLSEAAADRMIARGVMPLATLKETDSVRLVRLQSVALPSAPLSGRWGAQ